MSFTETQNSTLKTSSLKLTPTIPLSSALATYIRPIVVPKPKWTAKAPSIWIEKNNEDDTDYKYIFRQQLGFSLRKRVLNLPPPNPAFDYKFNPDIDTKELEKNLVLESTTSAATNTRIRQFVIEFWDVF